jgi:alkylated DNA repair protein alkB family protein 1
LINYYFPCGPNLYMFSALVALFSDKVIGLIIIPSFLPADIQWTLLSCLFLRDLSERLHTTNLNLHYDIQYPETGFSFFTEALHSVLFTPKDPQVHSSLNMERVLTKKLRWITLGGQYDWTNKIYPEEPPPAFPGDISNLLKGVFTDMEPQAAIVNLYSPGDTLSLHRDVSEEIDRGLVSISLGCDGIFIIGLRDSDDPSDSHASRRHILRLHSGDAVYMSGHSRYAWHGVPKIIPHTSPKVLDSWPGDMFPQWKDYGYMTNKRVNLNVRQMRDLGH